MNDIKDGDDFDDAFPAGRNTKIGANYPAPPPASTKPGEPISTGDEAVGVVVKPKSGVQRPPMYKVMLLNDDYTPMEFVVHVLERFFSIDRERAVQLMFAVHHEGVAVVGVFTFEIAETKVTRVMDYARENQHPLQCAMEKE